MKTHDNDDPSSDETYKSNTHQNVHWWYNKLKSKNKGTKYEQKASDQKSHMPYVSETSGHLKFLEER